MKKLDYNCYSGTLGNYYDVAKADEFENLFGDLAIGQNPTPRRNKYMIMKWDFSVVNAVGETADIKLNAPYTIT